MFANSAFVVFGALRDISQILLNGKHDWNEEGTIHAKRFLLSCLLLMKLAHGRPWSESGGTCLNGIH